MEYSISLSAMTQSAATEVNGPTYEPSTRVRAPMMTGPTTRDFTTWAPTSITTRPISSDPSSTSPHTPGSMPSSTILFTSSMSATSPVSFQYPVIAVDCTLRPVSIISWMASVISSSPRHDGCSWRTASCTAAVKM